jgi:hypothetical protein
VRTERPPRLSRVAAQHFKRWGPSSACLLRESYGELMQLDGSEHRWFEDRAVPCTLLVFIDGATGRLMLLYFAPQ